MIQQYRRRRRAFLAFVAGLNETEILRRRLPMAAAAEIQVTSASPVTVKIAPHFHDRRWSLVRRA